MKATNINTSLETVQFEVEKYFKINYGDLLKHKYQRGIFCELAFLIGYSQSEIGKHINMSSSGIFSIRRIVNESERIGKKGFENTSLEIKKIRQFLDVKAGY